MKAQSLLTRIAKIRPDNRVTVLNLEYGQAIKIEGEGSKALANYFCAEMYLDGDLATKWRVFATGSEASGGKQSARRSHRAERR